LIALYYITLKMEAVCSSEKLEQSHQATWYTNPKYGHHFNNCSENL